MATGKFKFRFTITKCVECPYKSDDGCYPGAVMCCLHPRANELNGDGPDGKGPSVGLGRGIIQHPECDIGFPPKCPLCLLPDDKVEKVDIA